MSALSASALASINGTPSTSTTSTSSTSSSGGTATEDRFLKLLVTQMQNQDPLNPMDNSQVTSQMAQINTVNGIDKLNTAIASLGSQFLQMQTLQGASLVGRGVLVEGKQLVMNDSGKGTGGFDLSGAADSVKVQVLNAAGQVVDTMDLGAETSGRHGFTWTPPSTVTDTSGLTFRVTATSGTANVSTTSLMADNVVAVSAGSDGLSLSLLRSGDVAYSAIKAFD